MLQSLFNKVADLQEDVTLNTGVFPLNNGHKVTEAAFLITVFRTAFCLEQLR